MNGKDLLDIMTWVDDDLISRSEVLPEESPISPVSSVEPVRNNVTQKGRKSEIRAGVGIGLAAAAIALIGFTLWKTGAFKPTSSPSTTAPISTPYHSTTTEPDVTTQPIDPTDSPTTTTVIVPTTVPGNVLFAPDQASGLFPNEMEGAFPGDVLISPMLLKEAQKPENQDRYFAVRIMVCRFSFVEEYVASHESSEDLTDLRIIELFDRQIREAIEEELRRFNSLGYDLVRVPISPYANLEDYDIYNGFTVEGYLTGEQISAFVSDPSHGYRFTWLCEGEETRNT